MLQQRHRWQTGTLGSPVLTTIPKTSSSVALSAHVCSTTSALKSEAFVAGLGYDVVQHNSCAAQRVKNMHIEIQTTQTGTGTVLISYHACQTPPCSSIEAMALDHISQMFSSCECADERHPPVVHLCQREWCASHEFLGDRHAHGPHHDIQSWTCVLEQPVSERWSMLQPDQRRVCADKTTQQ